MATKDPHIAMIDAHEAIEKIKTKIARRIAGVRAMAEQGRQLTEDDKRHLMHFRQRMIDEVKRIQDNLAEELHSHGFPGLD